MFLVCTPDPWAVKNPTAELKNCVDVKLNLRKYKCIFLRFVFLFFFFSDSSAALSVCVPV